MSCLYYELVVAFVVVVADGLADAGPRRYQKWTLPTTSPAIADVCFAVVVVVVADAQSAAAADHDHDEGCCCSCCCSFLGSNPFEYMKGVGNVP